MPKLSEEVQQFIVQAHACYRKTSLIRKDLKAEFDLDVPRQNILFYNPERGAKTKPLSQKWKDIFYATRKDFIEGKVRVGIASQTYRLSVYQRAADFYEEHGQFALAAEMAEKAAKETGGAYTNKREVTGEGGKPLIPDNVTTLILKVYGDTGDTGPEP